jgi:hypothetical protein
LLLTRAVSWFSASQSCSNVGGNLVLYKSHDEQLLVERYFGRTKWVSSFGWGGVGLAG